MEWDGIIWDGFGVNGVGLDGMGVGVGRDRVGCFMVLGAVGWERVG